MNQISDGFGQPIWRVKKAFQPPKSGKFKNLGDLLEGSRENCFNPLNRGNLNQIWIEREEYDGSEWWFQSPKSGKFESTSLKNAFRLTMSF